MTAAEAKPIDVLHMGRDRVICCWRIGDVIVDPGPATSLGPVIEELGEQGPRAILLTHIHLDHAGGAGTLARRWPDARIYVHERGAPHLIDPSKLLVSAERLYGDRMEELWGEVAPVPEENLTALSGDEEIEGFRVAYTPGHASHHVSYLDLASGAAFVGDTGGVRIDPSEYILPPTPPPDIDLEGWYGSLAQIEAWQPTMLGITHFGGFYDVADHLERMRERLGRAAELARSTTAGQFTQRLRDELAASADIDTAASYAQAAPLKDLHPGLDRYWRERT